MICQYTTKANLFQVPRNIHNLLEIYYLLLPPSLISSSVRNDGIVESFEVGKGKRRAMREHFVGGVSDFWWIRGGMHLWSGLVALW